MTRYKTKVITRYKTKGVTRYKAKEVTRYKTEDVALYKTEYFQYFSIPDVSQYGCKKTEPWEASVYHHRHNSHCFIRYKTKDVTILHTN